MKIFSIFDSKAAAYMTPFTLQSSAHAIRQISELMLSREASPFSDYPEDFTLMEIGSWDQLTGEIHPHSAFISHGNLAVMKAALKNRREQQQQLSAEVL